MGISISVYGTDHLYIGQIPGRERHALAIIDDEGATCPVAYFRSEEDAERFREKLQAMFNAALAGTGRRYGDDACTG